MWAVLRPLRSWCTLLDMPNKITGRRVDTRRRILLPEGSAAPGDMFLISVGDDGNITLVRAETVPLGSFGVNDPAAD